MSTLAGLPDRNMIPERLRRLGIYEYKGLYYLNKFRALEAAGSDYIRWDFNDAEFALHNFSHEPKQELYDLYAQRAWQLRTKYDRVILFYSGGIDSTVMLRAFVDNNIPIDAVIITGAFSTNARYSEINLAEQKKVALPYLEKLQKEKNIKLNIYCLDIVPAHKGYTEDWVYRSSYNLVPATTAISEFDKDPFVQNILSQGNTVALRGIDKPRLVFEKGKWYMAFLDVTIGGVSSRSDYNKDISNYMLEEFFYWSPDCPELLAKQAHVIAKELESRFTIAQCEQKFTKTSKFDKIGYGELVEPIVYGKYVKQEIGGKRTYFYVPPAFSGVMNTKSWWFFNAKEELAKDNQLFVQGLLTLKDKIDPMHFNKTPTDTSKMEKWAKYCPIDQRLLPTIGERDPLFGTVGCWSPFYYIKDYGV